MADDLDVATRCARTVALLHPTVIRRAPIGMYYLYEDRRLRLRVSDQAGLDDYGVWVPARGDDWTAVLLLSPTLWNPSGRRYFSGATGSRICAPWRCAGAGSSWIGARRITVGCNSATLRAHRVATSRSSAIHFPPPVKSPSNRSKSWAMACAKP